MRAIDGYILRQLVLMTVFITAALTAAVWLSQSLRFMDYIVNRGLPLGTFLHLVALLLPWFLGLVLPIAVFVAVLFLYNKLNNESELVVLRSAGMSQLRIARPALLLGLATTLAVYGIALYGLPASYHAFKNLQFKIRNDYSSVLLQAGTFNQISDNLTVYVRERTADGRLSNVLVHDDRGGAAPVTMMARRGALVQSETGPRVVLIDGNRQVVDPDTGHLSLLYFDRYTLDLGQLEETLLSRWRQPQERYLGQLLTPGPGPDDQRFRSELIAEGHRRLTFPLYTLAFPLVGLATVLSSGFNRHGQNRRIFGGVLAVAVLQAGQMMLTDIATRDLSAVPAMYILPAAAIGGALTVLVRPPRGRGRSTPLHRLAEAGR